jgi:8-oxo-dGTP pyrophosphatase MutT (NUDIX family)
MSEGEAGLPGIGIGVEDVREGDDVVARLFFRRWRGRELTSIVVRPDLRGQGIGDRLLVTAQHGGAWLLGRSDESDWYLARGYCPVEHGDGWTAFQPPTEREELQWAASLCLLSPSERAVLLGRRKTETWNGFWAFPGGGQEPGETLEETALREFEEETGITLDSKSLREETVYVASQSGKLYAVTNFVHLCTDLPEPVESDELFARWFRFEDIPNLEPVAAGTRRVLSSVLSKNW